MYHFISSDSQTEIMENIKRILLLLLGMSLQNMIRSVTAFALHPISYSGHASISIAGLNTHPSFSKSKANLLVNI